VHAEEALGTREHSRELADGDRARAGRDERVAGDARLDLAHHGALELRVLEDRLDRELRSRAVGDPDHHLQQHRRRSGSARPLRPLEPLVDARPRGGRARRDLAEDHAPPRSHQHLGDASSQRPAAHHEHHRHVTYFVMRDALICEPVRTAVGGFGGSLRAVPAAALAATVISAVMTRTGIPPELVDDVVLGQCYPNGEAPAIGRVGALDAGLPVAVPGLQLDRRCGSGLQAVLYAAMQVQTCAGDLIIAGGVESMSQAEHYTTRLRWGVRAGEVDLVDRLARGRETAGGVRHPIPDGMLETAENLRRHYRIGRREQDELALESHRRAIAARRLFAEEIVPVGEVDTDEHPRADTTLEKLAALRPILGRKDPEATVTAGNSSGQNDGAAVCVVTCPDLARELGLRPLARLRSWAVAGVEPERMGIGPVPATAKALERAGLRMEDMDLIELNEAFAAQVLAVLREWRFGDAAVERLNVHGSGISLGHPVGATGCRILTTLLREMDRRGAALGLETMCIGGGQGVAAVFERVG
jgi:acetyl-CoA C-acetyltransferase